MMTTRTGIERIEALCERLDALTERATLRQLKAWLAETRITYDDVVDWVAFDEETYRRNLIAQGEQYHLLALCWRSGQRSPIHNHAASTCAIRVPKGVATETQFANSPSNLIKAVSSRDCVSGDVTGMQDSDTHQVSNLQAAGNDLVTLHIYSPPLLRMGSFSLTDPHIAEFRPVIMEHVDGSGI